MFINLDECFKVKTGINRYESNSSNLSLVIFSQPIVRSFEIDFYSNLPGLF